MLGDPPFYSSSYPGPVGKKELRRMLLLGGTLDSGASEQSGLGFFLSACVFCVAYASEAAVTWSKKNCFCSEIRAE